MLLLDGGRVLGKSLKMAVKRVLGSLTNVVTNDPVVALTFDDGPHPVYTPRILEVLARHRAHATFFMVGQAAERYPDIVRAVANAGHAIGGHSWAHRSFRTLTGSERRREMRACEQILAPYGQPLCRPPYGEQSIAARLDAFWLGYEVVGWSSEIQDWWEWERAVLAERLIKCVRPGNIILLHDALFDEGKPNHGPTLERAAYVDRSDMILALENMLEHCSGSYRFVTVPELLRQGTPYRSFWFRKAGDA